MKKTQRDILLYDGDCRLCQVTVRRIMRASRGDSLRCVTQDFSSADGLPDGGDAVRLVKDGKQYSKTDAIIEAGRSVGGIWRLLVILRIFPRRLRDFFYDIVAKNRYRWFGKSKKRCN